ncbi:hypothetical protein ACHWQZ_G013420 [Mnemiopsis leidyi]
MSSHFPCPQFCSSPIKQTPNSAHYQLPNSSSLPSPVKPSTPIFRIHTVDVSCRTLFHSVDSEDSLETSYTKIGFLTFILEGSCISDLDNSEPDSWCSENCSLEPSILIQDSECSLQNRYPNLCQSLEDDHVFRSTPVSSSHVAARNLSSNTKAVSSSRRPTSRKRRGQMKGVVKSVISSLRRLHKNSINNS